MSNRIDTAAEQEKKTTNERWVLRPSPGQFRGQGRWEAFDGSDEDWEYLRATSYLPTKEGDKPEDYE